MMNPQELSSQTASLVMTTVMKSKACFIIIFFFFNPVLIFKYPAYTQMDKLLIQK